MPVCPGFLEDTGPGCDLAHNHGGPHYADGIWWEQRPEPPDWKPPSFTAAITAIGENNEVMFNTVVNPDGPTEIDMTPHFGFRLKLRVHRLPRIREDSPPVETS